MLTESSNHAWVHFACHGHQDLEHPSSGGLAVYDGLLTIRDIALQRLSTLSSPSCPPAKPPSAAAASPTRPSTLPLPCSSRLPHVIATLWSPHDRSGRVIAEHTYATLADPAGGLDITHAAEALHYATRQLRDRRPNNPTMWASYIHVGP